MKDKLYRVIDANLNRSREGLRVIEDIARFCLNDKKATALLKKIRHEITGTVKNTDILLFCRNSKKDVGKKYNASLEGSKKRIKDIVISNFRRVEESLRVLEDISKIVLPQKTEKYKNLRFRVYSLEKKLYERI